MDERPHAPSSAASAAALAYERPMYRWYVTGLMTLIFACHAMDRGMPNILVEPVRHEFNLTDAQLSVFTGVAFGLSFGLFVLPMGFISDRVSRRNFLAVILVLWSVLTTAGAIARNFVQLVALRFGVGAAESGFAPVTLPMVTGIMPPNRRSFALGIVYMGGPIGGLLATWAGGYIAQHYGWRDALLLAGIPGILLAILLLSTVKEPPRSAEAASAPPPKVSEVFAFLIGKPALLLLILGCSCLALVGIAIGAWLGSFFIRIHHLSLTEVGLLLGLGGSICSLVANPFWGWLGGVMAPRGRHWPTTICAINCLISMLATAAMLFTGNVFLAIVGFLVSDLTRSGYSPLTYTVLLEQTPERMRGTVMSILQLGSNLAGFGLGPLLIGILSDMYGGGTAIRYAMAYSLVIFLIAAICIWSAGYFLFNAKNKQGDLAPA